MSNRRMSVLERWQGMCLLAGVVLVWELGAHLNVINAAFLPPPTQIAAAFADAITSGEMAAAALLTLARCLGGYALTAIAGIILGVLMGISQRIYSLLEPLIEMLRPIPSAAVIPIAILFLGIDERMKLAVIMFGSLWPILLNTIHGVRSVDPLLIDTGRTFNLTGSAFLWKIVIPASLPHIATGLRISLAISLILTITVEMIAGSSGLGFLILDYERSFRYPPMYAGIVLLGLIGFLLNAVVVSVERRWLAWTRQSLPST